jgi:hypothetical protein
MEKPSDPVQRLRESTIREAGTSRVLEKPPAPAMRVVEKGAWTYREVPPGDLPARGAGRPAEAEGMTHSSAADPAATSVADCLLPPSSSGK